MAVAQAPTAIARYDRNKYNILVPTQHLMQVSPWFAVSVSEVRVDPDPSHGDVYEVGTRYDPEKRTTEKMYALAKPALFRVAAAAGISWYAPLCKLLAVNDSYVCYQAAAYLRLPDGTPQLITATKEIDLRVIEAEIRQKYEKEAEGPVSPDAARRYKGEWRQEKDRDGKVVSRFYLAEEERRRYVEAQVAAAMIQWRKNKLMRAETGAMLRCIRAALAMRSAYTREELQRPFVVPRVSFAPDLSDPQVRATILQTGGLGGLQSLMAAPAAMLGPGPVGTHAAPAAAALQAPADDDEVYDVAPEVDSPLAPAQVQPVQHEEEAAQPNPPPPPPPPPSQAPTGQATAEEAPPVPEPPATQGDLFGPPPPPANPRRKGGGETLAYCSGCGKAITSQNVLDYSMQRWGAPLCYACGQKRKNGGGQGG